MKSKVSNTQKPQPSPPRKQQQSNIRLKKIIAWLFTIGIILLVVSTIQFSYRIPSIDSKININERALENYWKGYTNYKHSDVLAYMARSTSGIIELLPSSDKQKELLNTFTNDFIALRRDQLIVTYENKKEPTQSEVDSWSKLSIDQLNYKTAHSFANYFQGINVKAKELEDLNKSKKSIVFWSILIQILGLLLNQIAIILRLRLSN